MRFSCTPVLAVLILIFAAAPLRAQNSGDIFNESSADNFFGIGGRAVGMSEAVTASVLDGTALLYNPAGLVRIMRPEFYGALTNEKVKCVSTLKQGSAAGGDDFAKTRLNTLSLAVPVPTYRGALVVAFGLNRSKSFDRTYAISTMGFVNENALEQIKGGIDEYSAGAAVQISPHLAVGTTLIYYHGTEDYYWDYTSSYDFNTIHYNDDITNKYSGVGIRLGMTAEVNPYLTLGVSVDSPTRLNIDQEYVQVTDSNGVHDESPGTYSYKLQQPFIFNFGAALRIKTLTIEGDIGYADWSQLEYKTADLRPDNAALQKYYRDVVQFRIGGEYVIPKYDVVIRGGYKRDPLPISGNVISNQIEKDRQSFSLGLGFLIDKIVMLDVAYAHASYTMYDGGLLLSSKFTSSKALVSVGYRI